MQKQRVQLFAHVEEKLLTDKYKHTIVYYSFISFLKFLLITNVVFNTRSLRKFSAPGLLVLSAAVCAYEQTVPKCS
jgi:hypothetical protein